MAAWPRFVESSASSKNKYSRGNLAELKKVCLFRSYLQSTERPTLKFSRSSKTSKLEPKLVHQLTSESEFVDVPSQENFWHIARLAQSTMSVVTFSNCRLRSEREQVDSGRLLWLRLLKEVLSQMSWQPSLIRPRLRPGLDHFERNMTPARGNESCDPPMAETKLENLLETLL